MRIKAAFRRGFVVLALLGTAVAQQAGNAPKNSAGTSLDSVLHSMDVAAGNFHTTQANFEWAQFETVLNDFGDTQRGKIYFRRGNGQVEMAAEVNEPKPTKFVLFTDGRIELYETGINRVTVHNAAKNREAFETFLVLGFGGSGHDLLKSFDVSDKGTETVGGIAAQVLDLVPKSEKVRGTIPRITLWIDPARGISIQQKMYEANGYRLAKYSDIEINKNLPEGAFKLKTNSKTETITQ
jgi:outer membrane lipoprotein-sorting protein